VGPDDPVDGPAFVRFLEGLQPGELPDGADYLRRAFTHLQQQHFEPDPALRAELIALANLEIGVHEQMRVQPEIQSALDAPLVTKRDLRARVIDVLVPAGTLWRTLLGRGPVAVLIGGTAHAVRRHADRIAREVITECLMVLTLPDGTVLPLGRPLEFPVPAALQSPVNPDFQALLARFGPAGSGRSRSGATDWARFDDRMPFIVHLFCALHARRDLFEPPFTEAQVRHLLDGRIPEGRL
jgi:hypothetical protein